MHKSITSWELLGIPFIVVCGSALHFAFDWSAHWWPVAVFAAVNESVWEHLKLAFWPALLWALIEYRHLGLERRFWASKGMALLVSPIVITLVFYGYTSLLGTNILILDIATFVLAVACSQLVSIWLLQSQALQGQLQFIGLGLLACQLAAFALLTYLPPALPIFEDPRNGWRGIPTEETRGLSNHAEGS